MIVGTSTFQSPRPSELAETIFKKTYGVLLDFSYPHKVQLQPRKVLATMPGNKYHVAGVLTSAIIPIHNLNDLFAQWPAHRAALRIGRLPVPLRFINITIFARIHLVSFVNL